MHALKFEINFLQNDVFVRLFCQIFKSITLENPRQRKIKNQCNYSLDFYPIFLARAQGCLHWDCLSIYPKSSHPQRIIGLIEKGTNRREYL